MLRKILIIEVVLFVLIVLGIVPRTFSLLLGAGLAISVLALPLEEAVLLFVSSIPLFLALPFTATFDNFNTWRIVSILIFLRWLVQKETLVMLRENITAHLQSYWRWHTAHFVVTGLFALLILALLSLIDSPDFRLGLKRIIYFGNLCLIGIVLYDIAKRNQLFIERSIRAIAIPTMLVIVAGFIQVISTYVLDIYQFMALWGEGIQLRQFGTTWSYIAVELGNTWFAYYGDQLSLRVFSLFPDSHSFPQFVLLGIPALMALSLDKVLTTGKSLVRMTRTRARLFVVWVPLGFLIAILSGTRGIWAASLGVVLLAGVLIWWLRRYAEAQRVVIFKYLATYLVLFFLLFSVAYPIFVSPQFLLSKGDFSLLSERIRSILDFGETSNAQRILIWKKSLISIKEHPLLGVGIGNFPVVLGEDLFLARAGSSAHNIYLHIAAEMGIPALLIVLWLLWKLSQKTYQNYLAAARPQLLIYYGAALLSVPWVLAYSLTDVALFDERSFLLFVVTSALIAGYYE